MTISAQKQYMPGFDNNYLVAGNLCNAFVLGELGSREDFYLMGTEPEDQSNYPVLNGTILDSQGNLLFRLAQNIIVENPGDLNLTGVRAELRNHADCGSSSEAEIGRIEPGNQKSATIRFNASDSMNECDARLIVSSEGGNYAFADVNIDIVEEDVVVPEEFRVPLVASLWTVLLLIYSISFRKFDLESSNMLKLPLVLLVVGEVFILVYLSSTYYGMIPGELVPF